MKIVYTGVCCKCGGNSTYIRPEGTAYWHGCSCGKKGCTKHICHECFKYNERIKAGIAKEKYHENIKCCICGNDISLYDHKYKNKDDKGYWTEKWECKKCWQHNYDMNNPNSHNVMMKTVTNWRNGQLDPLSNTGKGFIGQQIVAKRYGIDDCNLKMNNFHFCIDLDSITGYGYCEIKTSSFNTIEKIWHFSGMKRSSDTFFFVCMDENVPWKNVERMYAIPSGDVIHRTSVTIIKNPLRKVWYDNFRIDEKLFNDAYHNIRLEKCKVLRRN